MPPIEVDHAKSRTFKDGESFYRWLAANHDRRDELWIEIHKFGSCLASVAPKEAIDVALCWGWIDGVRKGFDDRSFLQRYGPRGKRSVWSQINVANVARLVKEGRMTVHGLKQVELAKADGRWQRAYRVKGGRPRTTCRRPSMPCRRQRPCSQRSRRRTASRSSFASPT